MLLYNDLLHDSISVVSHFNVKEVSTKDEYNFKYFINSFCLYPIRHVLLSKNIQRR